MFYRKVNIKSKKEMIGFLSGHFKYWSMNSWNRSSSYANNLKIYNVIPRDLQDKAYEIMEQSDIYDEINELIHDFGNKHDWIWQAGFNGRSGGYLVLYTGGKKESGYKTRCDTCGRLTWYEEEQSCHVDGCGGTLRLIEQPHYQVYTQPGLSTDADENFHEWDTYSLKERVKLIQEFDKLCDDIVNMFIDYCKSYEVKEEEIQVPKTIKVLVEKVA